MSDNVVVQVKFVVSRLLERVIELDIIPFGWNKQEIKSLNFIRFLETESHGRESKLVTLLTVYFKRPKYF